MSKKLNDGEICYTDRQTYFVYSGNVYALSADEFFELDRLSECDRLNKFQELYRNRRR